MRDEISARVYGSDGYISTDYFGSVWIRGKEFYDGGKTGNLVRTPVAGIASPASMSYVRFWNSAIPNLWSIISYG
jgi:hypothetical protein